MGRGITRVAGKRVWADKRKGKRKGREGKEGICEKERERHREG